MPRRPFFRASRRAILATALVIALLLACWLVIAAFHSGAVAFVLEYLQALRQSRAILDTYYSALVAGDYGTAFDLLVPAGTSVMSAEEREAARHRYVSGLESAASGFGYRVTAYRIRRLVDQEMHRWQVSVTVASDAGTRKYWEMAGVDRPDAGLLLVRVEAWPRERYRTRPVDPFLHLRDHTAARLSTGR